MKNHLGKFLCLITTLFVTGMAGATNYPARVDIQRILASEHTERINDPIFQDAAAKDSKAHDEVPHCELLDRVEWDTTADLWQVQAHISNSGEQPPQSANSAEKQVTFTFRDEEMAKAMVHAVELCGSGGQNPSKGKTMKNSSRPRNVFPR